MNKSTRISIFLLRVALGFLFFYAGITKIMNPDWSAAGYLRVAKTFPELFQWFASDSNLIWINPINEWGLTLIGLALIFGIFVRWASLGGILLMLLYYLPVLEFPYIAPHSYIVDEHVIYALVFLLFFASNAGKFWGLDGIFRKHSK